MILSVIYAGHCTGFFLSYMMFWLIINPVLSVTKDGFVHIFGDTKCKKI